MRLTSKRLRQLIKEEVQAVISEGFYGAPTKVSPQVMAAFKQAKAACKQHEKAGRVLATLENGGISFSCVVQKM